MMSTNWRQWLDRIDWQTECWPVVYDRYEHEIDEPWCVFGEPSTEAVLAELAATPLPADGAEEDRRLQAALDVADAIAAVMQREQQAIDAEVTAYNQRCERLQDLFDVVCSALGLRLDDWEFAASGSRYATYRDLSLRVSDHPQVAGGGFDEERRERRGEVDVDFHAGQAHTRQSVRLRVAAALRTERAGESIFGIR